MGLLTLYDILFFKMEDSESSIFSCIVGDFCRANDSDSLMTGTKSFSNGDVGD